VAAKAMNKWSRPGLVRSDRSPNQRASCQAQTVGLGFGMTSNSDELAGALQENLKLRRELATEVAEAKGEKLAAIRYRLARIFGAFRYTFFGRRRRASVSATVVELMTLDGAREQYAAQLRQLDRQGLLKEIEQLRRLLSDLPAP
jgi:hypothetical protein